MKIETLKEIIKKKLSNEQFAVLTNLSNGSSEIFKLGLPISKNFINYKNEIENYYNLKKVVSLMVRRFLFKIILSQLK